MQEKREKTNNLKKKKKKERKKERKKECMNEWMKQLKNPANKWKYVKSKPNSTNNTEKR